MPTSNPRSLHHQRYLQRSDTTATSSAASLFFVRSFSEFFAPFSRLTPPPPSSHHLTTSLSPSPTYPHHHPSSNSTKTMSPTTPTSLRNPLHFPSFTACPLFANLDLNYYHTLDGTNYQQSRHWCFLGEVLEVEYSLRLRLVVRDITGIQIVVAFYLNDNFAKQPRGVRVGDTIAVLYANQWGFMDGTVGFRIENAVVVQVCLL